MALFWKRPPASVLRDYRPRYARRMSIVLSLLGGAAAAALIGLLGAWIQSRREHERWLREKKYEAYVEFTAIVDEMKFVYGANDETDVSKDRSEMQRLLTELSLLGPRAVYEATDDYWNAYYSRREAGEPVDEDDWIRARNAYLAAMRKELKVKY